MHSPGNWARHVTGEGSSSRLSPFLYVKRGNYSRSCLSKLDTNKPRENCDGLVPGVERSRGSVITPTPPSSPRPRQLSGDSCTLGVHPRGSSEFIQLNLSQDSNSDVFLITEHNSGFLRSSSSLHCAVIAL